MPNVAPATPACRPSFGEAFRFWLKLGFISFGGPAGQIAIMHEELVEKRRWISESDAGYRHQHKERERVTSYQRVLIKLP